ncbi:MAG: AraC family transcriptional regulator [Clostridiales bacterium]|nr:AraC family transcriptional regulator [Clostridiales bacterium]MBS5878388.1 AraC family transcriptional regulator [Clostridiales bacterium]MDU0939828.1 helix-turn-helix transcriptional regulator [Clostridiales bacterium]MDU1042672.1 helix-turn-helix transcriptional regulator [Clostridiales bacterium]MDU3489550.1 helix-turn-helix transcriptional regulator [Clostridiales bacterium]
MNKQLQLIQPFIYADFSQFLTGDKEISRPYHLYFYELAPQQPQNLIFNFIASPYTEWIIGYDDISFFNGNACFWGIGASSKSFQVEIPAFQHYFCIRFDDDLTFINKNAPALLPADLFETVQAYKPTGNTYEYRLIEEFQSADSFAKKVRLFLTYLKASKKQPVVPQSAGLIQNALKESKPDITIAEVAKDYDYTPRHVGRIFKENYGYTPKDYLRFLRVQYVLSAMLKNPDGTNRSFSQDLGYNDAAHFQREFKEFLGITPREYLQKIR